MDSPAFAQSLRSRLNMVLSREGIRVSVIDVSEFDLRIFATRVNGTATTRVVSVHAGGLEVPKQLLDRVAQMIREAFAEP